MQRNFFLMYMGFVMLVSLTGELVAANILPSADLDEVVETTAKKNLPTFDCRSFFWQPAKEITADDVAEFLQAAIRNQYEEKKLKQSISSGENEKAYSYQIMISSAGNRRNEREIYAFLEELIRSRGYDLHDSPPDSLAHEFFTSLLYSTGVYCNLSRGSHSTITLTATLPAL